MGKSDYTFRYKVRNWPEYNRALVKRGQLTLWFDTEAVAAWRHPGPFEGRGRPKVYADAAIQCALVLNSVFHLNLRTTQGFLQSIVALMALDLPVPNYSTVSRRQKRRRRPTECTAHGSTTTCRHRFDGPETEQRLAFLASQTGRSKSFYLREIIERSLEDMEDYYLAADVLERLRQGKEYPVADVKNALDLDD